MLFIVNISKYLPLPTTKVRWYKITLYLAPWGEHRKNDLQRETGQQRAGLKACASCRELLSTASTHTAFPSPASLLDLYLQMTLQSQFLIKWSEALRCCSKQMEGPSWGLHSRLSLIQHVLSPLHCAPPEGCVCLSLCDLCGATLKRGWLNVCVFPVYPSRLWFPP